MRVLFLNNFHYIRGGSERVVFEEMRMLKEAGHEVAIYSRANSLNEPSKYDRFFPPPMDTENLSLSFASLKTAKELIYSREAKEGLMRVIDEFRPDVAHAHNIYGRLSLSVLDTLRNKGIPAVLTLHDYKIICPSYLMFNHGVVCERCRGGRVINAVTARCHKDSLPASLLYAVESWFNYRFRKYDAARLLISPSRFLMEKVIGNGWDSRRVVLIPNCVNSISIGKSEGPGEYLLYFGRLSREKGVHTLLDAVLKLDGMSLPVMIVGDGPERQSLRMRAGGNGHAVTFTGYLRGESLLNVIAGAKAVVVPSLCYENAPLSIIESFAHAKPVIGARIGGIPEMIDHGVNGFLFEPGSADDLKEAIIRLVRLNHETIVEMGRAARKKAETEYGPAAHFDSLISLYERTRKGSDLKCASPI